MDKSNNIIAVFFDRSFERSINEKMFYRDYEFPEEEVVEYCLALTRCSMTSFIRYIREESAIPFLDYNDFVQFSSLADATVGITKVIEDHGDEGFSYVDIGKMLLDDGAVRKETAYRKYGENHTKTAQEFGLTQILFSKTYLTCIGKIINDLSESMIHALLRRLILRNRYIKLMIKLSGTERLSLDSQMGLLANTTKIRRLSNIRKLWQFILEEDYETVPLLSRVIA